MISIHLVWIILQAAENALHIWSRHHLGHKCRVVPEKVLLLTVLHMETNLI